MLALLSVVLPKAVWAIVAGVMVTFVIVMFFNYVALIYRSQDGVRLCREKKCTYYTHYLTKGPADLSHSQYHCALDSYNWWKERLELREPVCPEHEAYKLFELYKQQIRVEHEIAFVGDEEITESLRDA